MWRTALGVVCFLAGMVPALGQGEPNLAGKSVRMVIGSAPGGTYDLLGRAVARHIGRHLPGNPSVVPQNMPGAGGLVAANHIYNVAPKDGTVIGMFNQSMPQRQMLEFRKSMAVLYKEASVEDRQCFIETEHRIVAE